MVIAGFEIVKDMFDFAISVNQEADAMNTIVGFAHEGLLPDAELLAHLVVLIRQERKVEQASSAKRKVFGFIGADTQHINARFFQLIHVIA